MAANSRISPAWFIPISSTAARQSSGKRRMESGTPTWLLKLPTVFPAGTDVHVRREGSKLWAPGISDNGTGLATLSAVARIMRDTKLETRSSILFVADVGEEGEGNLRGIRKLVENYRKQLRYVIALDGASPSDTQRIVWHRAAFDGGV